MSSDNLISRRSEIGEISIESEIADHLSRFLRWSDSKALAAVEKLVRENAAKINWHALHKAVDVLETPNAEAKRRLNFAVRSIGRAAKIGLTEEEE